MMNPNPVTPQHAIAAVAGKPSRPAITRGLKESAIRYFCLLCALVSVLTTIGIVVVLVWESIPFFRAVPLPKFLGGTDWHPTLNPPTFCVLPLVTGTLMITVGAGIIAIPLGLLTAIYLSEYAPAWLRHFLKPALELLGGIPTVVFGYFGLFFVTPLLRHVIPGIQSSNALAGAIVVGIMILPLVSSLCEDAIAAVPRAMKEAAYGLGATKFEVTTKTVVPAAFSGVMAAFILALSRALGETMAVALAAGATPILTLNPAKSIQTMTSFIVMTTQGDAPAGTVRYQSLFAVGVVLFVFTMAMNMLAQRLVRRFRQAYE